jgi:hypothetical protein
LDFSKGFLILIEALPEKVDSRGKLFKGGNYRLEKRV